MVVRLVAVLVCTLVMAFGPAGQASAHEIRPAMVVMAQTAPAEFEVSWKQPVRDGLRLKLALRFPETCSASPTRPEIVPGALIERWTLMCDPEWIGVDGLDRTLTDIFVETQRLDGTRSAGVLRAGETLLDLTADTPPAALAFFRLGVEHIIFGYDHLLFVLGLVALVRTRQLLLTVTAFTLGHSVTLSLAALGVVGLPGPPVEIVIALSLVLLAAESLYRQRGRETLGARIPWAIALGFGLIHGFGFAGALADIGLPEGESLLALTLFNLGVEAGQLAVVAALLAVGWALTRLPRLSVEPARAFAAYLVGTAGVYWMIERISGSFL